MYTYGVEGDDAYLSQQQYQSPYENNYAPDEEAPSPRGEIHTPFIGYFSSHLLRTGFFLQCVSLVLMFIFYWAFGGTGIFVFDLYAGPECVKVSSSFHLTISVLMAIYLLGTLYIAMFQVFVADNSKWCRGFRAGSKLLSAAVTLDILSSILRLVQYLYAYFYMSMRWWARYQQTKSDWTLLHFGSIVHSFALFIYGAAFFYMEAYHDEGTYEELAWSNLTLFKLAGLAELLMVFSGFGAFFSILLLGAITCATIWAFSFEPLLEKWSPELHSRDLNSDVLPEMKHGDEGNAYNEETNYEQYNANPENNEYGEEMMQQNTSVKYMTEMPNAYDGNMYGQTNAIPTTYDYSQIEGQLKQNIEMGVSENNYNNTNQY